MTITSKQGDTQTLYTSQTKWNRTILPFLYYPPRRGQPLYEGQNLCPPQAWLFLYKILSLLYSSTAAPIEMEAAYTSSAHTKDGRTDWLTGGIGGVVLTWPDSAFLILPPRTQVWSPRGPQLPVGVAENDHRVTNFETFLLTYKSSCPCSPYAIVYLASRVTTPRWLHFMWPH